MSIQYLYPTEDVQVQGWQRMTCWGNSYNNISFAHHISEGVENTYNNGEFIRIYQSTNPTNGGIWSNAGIGAIFPPATFKVSNVIKYVPTSIQFNLKYVNAQVCQAPFVNLLANQYAHKIKNICLLNGNNEIIASSANSIVCSGTQCIYDELNCASGEKIFHNLEYINGDVKNYDNPKITWIVEKGTPKNVGGYNLRMEILQIHAVDLKLEGTQLVKHHNNAAMHIHGYLPIDSGISLFTEGAPYKTSSLHIHGHDNINSDITLITSGENISRNKINLHTFNSENINSGIDLFTKGAISLDSGIPLYLKRCTKEVRLQPLYDNEANPSPIESGYPGYLYYPEYPEANAELYHGTGRGFRWGFGSLLKDYNLTDKLHFNIDDADGDLIYGVRRPPVLWEERRIFLTSHNTLSYFDVIPHVSPLPEFINNCPFDPDVEGDMRCIQPILDIWVQKIVLRLTAQQDCLVVVIRGVWLHTPHFLIFLLE